MKNTIHIPEPCLVKWSSMKDVGSNQRHCDSCKTNVHDFSKSTLSEINNKINAANGERLCGFYHERHTNNIKTIYVLTNALDNAFSKTRLKRFSLIIISMILLFAGCARRRTAGYVKLSKQKDNNEQKQHVKI